MKKIILSFFIGLLIFPFFTLAACSTRSSVNSQCQSNCTGSNGTYNSSDCSCTCRTGFYSTSSCSCLSNSYQGSEAESEVYDGSSSESDSSDDSSDSETGLGSSTGVISNPIDANSFAELVDMVVEWILDIAMVLAPLIIVYGGFTYITAAGDPAKMKTGKQIIIYAAIGFILALLASSLVGIFKDLVLK